jgi:hypothetical protein
MMVMKCGTVHAEKEKQRAHPRDKDNKRGNVIPEIFNK